MKGWNSSWIMDGMDTQFITGPLRLICFSVPISPTELSTLMISRISDLDWQCWNTFGNICVLRSLINPRDSYRNVHRLTPIGNTTSNFLNHPILYLLPFEWLFSWFFWLLEHKKKCLVHFKILQKHYRHYHSHVSYSTNLDIWKVSVSHCSLALVSSVSKSTILEWISPPINHRPLTHIYPPKRFFLPFRNQYFSYAGDLTFCT